MTRVRAEGAPGGGGGGGGGAKGRSEADFVKLKKKCEKLEEENNMLKYKFEVLVDMVRLALG